MRGQPVSGTGGDPWTCSRWPRPGSRSSRAVLRAFSPDKRLYRRFEEVVRGALAAGSARVSEMVATLPSPLQNRFHQAKALYRFLSNPRVEAEALLDRVYQESATALEGEEVLVLLDLEPGGQASRPGPGGDSPGGEGEAARARAPHRPGVGPRGAAGSGVRPPGGLRGEGFVSLPKEVEGAIEAARERLGAWAGGWCMWRTGV